MLLMWVREGDGGMKKREGGGLYNEYVYVHFFRNTLIKKTLFKKKMPHEALPPIFCSSYYYIN